MTSNIHIHPFEDLLNDFLDDTMARWFELTKQRIGLSIQLKGSVQNRTPTREQQIYSDYKMGAHYRNTFCRKTYEDKDKKSLCNSLDYHLKKKISPGNIHDSISCRCHQGISNVLIPYQYPKDYLDIIWYIYIGQFILLDESVLYKPLAKKMFAEFNIQDVNILNSLTDEEKVFIQPEIFIKKRALRNRFDDYVISKIRFIDFLQFRLFVLTRFQDFLDEIYSKPNGINKSRSSKEKIDILKDFVNIKEDTEDDLVLLDKVYTILDKLPKWFPTKKLNDRVEVLLPRFSVGDSNNIIFIKNNRNKIESTISLAKEKIYQEEQIAISFIKSLEELCNNEL